MHRPIVRILLAALAAIPAGCAAPDGGLRMAPPGRVAPIAVEPIERPGGETSAWWFRAGAAEAAARGAMAGEARNVIVFIGDGMGLSTIAAARILEGQRRGAPGEEHRLAFEDLPHTALARTYNSNAQTADSAGTMTAILAGVKTRMGVLAVGPSARRADCTAAQADELATLFEIAESAGLSTGIVTTTRLTHATPAAAFAHAPERNWEDDVAIAPAAAAAGCTDLARQFVEPRVGDGIDVALAGGRAQFMPASTPDPEHPDRAGRRADGRDLVAQWRTQHPDGDYVWNAAQLAALDPRGGAPLLGLFAHDHLAYEHDRPRVRAGEPSLPELTRRAIARLSARGTGFVLLVEAGRIDHAHHAGNAYRALVDTIALSDAVRVALADTDPNETLVVVTADHSHTLTFAGYPVRGNPILGKVGGLSGRDPSGRPALARDALGLPYTTLGYANGPGYSGASDRQPEGAKRYKHDFSAMAKIRAGRPDLGAVDTADPDFLQEATVPLRDETHGGEDVAVFAGGPGAHAFRGSLEQNVLFHVMLQATPRLREQLCAIGRCNADGVPVALVRPADLPQ